MEIDVKGILERNKETLANQIEAITKEQLKEALEYQANDIVAEAVNEFLEKEIAPTLLKQLKEQKAVILAGLAEGLEKVVAEFGKVMFQKAKKNLANSYDFKKIIQTLFD